MNKHNLISLSLAIVAGVMTSCQPGPKEVQDASTLPKETSVGQNIKPAESGTRQRFDRRKETSKEFAMKRSIISKTHK